MQETDRHWFAKHLTAEILPRWLESAATERGAFLPRLDREWRRRDDQVATLVSQSRLLYSFAQGWRLTGETAYRDAVVSGARFIDPEFGGWYAQLNPDGTPARRDKGSEWKVDYHTVGMCAEAVRLGL